ncbi:DUF177 domain-containing protein [Thermodesulfobacteriota bacterium]
MIIDLKAIPRDGNRVFEFFLEKEWWHPDGRNDHDIRLDTPLTVRIEIYRAGNKYVLKGDLAGSLQVRCDKCLSAYRRDVRSTFKVIFEKLPPYEEKAEVELLEEEMNISFIRGEEIDLDEIIQEQLYLSLPIKSLCKEECLGLCPTCGTNLNDEDCQCEMRQGHPGFSKLKSLKIERE